MSNKIYSVLKRFVKGIISGAVSAMMLVQLIQPTNWSDFGSILNSLGIAAAFGALTGLLLALNKWASWTD